MSYTFALKNIQSLPTITFFFNFVLGPWLWPRPILSLASRGSVLKKSVLGFGLEFFLSPWPQTLCPRLQVCFKYRTRSEQLECDD